METLAQRLIAAREAKEWSQPELAKKAGVSQSTIGNLEAGLRKRPRELLAIAHALGVEPRWLETGIGTMSKAPANYEIAERLPRALKKEESTMLAIPQLDVRASMGIGVDLQEHVDVVRMVRVSLPQLRRLLPSFSAPQNLAILTGYGDSMTPTFSDGDPLVVDTGVNEVRVDGVYVLERNDELFIKRLQRQLDGTLLMISDNAKYKPQHIEDAEREKFAVRGRVLLAWRAERL